MAYNPNLYSPYGQPYTWQQNMPTVTTPSTMQPVNGLVSVTGIEGAKAYQLPPNSSMPLFDNDKDILYVKTTDAGGFPTIKAFRFEAMDQEPEPKTEYATKADLEALVARIDELTPKPRTRKASDGE